MSCNHHTFEKGHSMETNNVANSSDQVVKYVICPVVGCTR